MQRCKWPIGTALLLTAGLVGAISGTRGDDTSTTHAAGWTKRIDQRIEAWQPTKAERRLDDIGWAKDIRDALRLAKANQRPVFLFTYSGSSERPHALALQRC
jgi:hypothetical protein